MNRLQFLNDIELAAAQTRLHVLNDPSALIALTIGSTPRPDMAAYWSTLRDLRTQVSNAAREHWRLLEPTGNWLAMFDVGRRWLRAQYGLFRLYLGGWLRLCCVVGVVDARAALDAVEGLQ